jgi:hypothetical protein
MDPLKNPDVDPDAMFTITLYEMEMERIRYALVRYLRTRLTKIEDQLHLVVSDPEHHVRLSSYEKVKQRFLRHLDSLLFSFPFLSFPLLFSPLGPISIVDILPTI